jgi:hypothetical protein
LTITYTYPDSFEDALYTCIFFGFLLLITWPAVRKRGLPVHYVLCGLLFITGSVYAATLDTRKEDALAFRLSVGERLERHPVMLGLLTFAMALYLAVGAGLALATAISPLVPSRIIVNGRETTDPVQILPGVLVAVYSAAVGLFHFAVTRRRVKALIGSLEAT